MVLHRLCLHSNGVTWIEKFITRGMHYSGQDRFGACYYEKGSDLVGGGNALNWSHSWTSYTWSDTLCKPELCSILNIIHEPSTFVPSQHHSLGGSTYQLISSLEAEWSGYFYYSSPLHSSPLNAIEYKVVASFSVSQRKLP